jgi:uncharacterized protein YjiS (DUF1127 family)
MITLPTSAQRTPFARALRLCADIAARVGRRVATAWRHRGDLGQLAAFDDRMLRDIGLNRCDLNDALSEPLWRDPTAVLARRQHERRQAFVAGRRADVVPGRAAPSIVPGVEPFPKPRRDSSRRAA